MAQLTQWVKQHCLPQLCVNANCKAFSILNLCKWYNVLSHLYHVHRANFVSQHETVHYIGKFTILFLHKHSAHNFKVEPKLNQYRKNWCSTTLLMNEELLFNLVVVKMVLKLHTMYITGPAAPRNQPISIPLSLGSEDFKEFIWGLFPNLQRRPFTLLISDVQRRLNELTVRAITPMDIRNWIGDSILYIRPRRNIIKVLYFSLSQLLPYRLNTQSLI